MPKWMDDCVKSVKKKNPDYSEQKVWAICTDAYKKEFGHPPSEGDDFRLLTESYKANLLVEEAQEDDGFAFVISGTVIPAPSTEHGTYSRNHRLYPEACIKEAFDKSTTFLEEEIATIHTSHSAAYPSMFGGGGRLPIGKVTELWMEDGAMKFRGGVADTADGRDVCSLIESNILERVSLRTNEWKSEFEEVGDLGRVEVMEWFVLHGIDFTETPGLDDTRIVKEAFEDDEEEEETEMDFKELTLAQLQEARPDLIAEIVEGSTPEPTVEYQTPPDVALEMLMLKAANSGGGSLVLEYLQEHVKEESDLTDEVLQEAREHAAKTLYGRHNPAPPSNLKGDATPAPPPEDSAEEEEEEDTLTESQREMVILAGGTLTE